MKMKQWINDKLFALLTWLSPTEQPTPGEYEAWALAEAQKPPQPPQIWIDPTVRSYPQPPVLHLPTGEWSRQWREGHKPPAPPVVRTNTEPIDPATDFPDWLRSGPLTVEHMTPAEIERVLTIRDLAPKFDPLNTDEYPAVVALLHQEREQRRQAG